MLVDKAVLKLSTLKQKLLCELTIVKKLNRIDQYLYIKNIHNIQIKYCFSTSVKLTIYLMSN